MLGFFKSSLSLSLSTLEAFERRVPLHGGAVGTLLRYPRGVFLLSDCRPREPLLRRARLCCGEWLEGGVESATDPVGLQPQQISNSPTGAGLMFAQGFETWPSLTFLADAWNCANSAPLSKVHLCFLFWPPSSANLYLSFCVVEGGGEEGDGCSSLHF